MLVSLISASLLSRFSIKVQLPYPVIPSSHDHQLFYFHPVNHHYVYAGLYPLRSPLTIG
jgi:hypothetical protein